MTVYEKIDKALKDHENRLYATKNLDSIADYIDWAWKWHKITPKEKDEVCDRVCALYEQDLRRLKNGTR